MVESCDITRLGDRIKSTSDQFIFAGVIALTRTAQQAQRAVRDVMGDVFILRNKWTLGGIRITPATRQSQQSEVYSKDWYMPVHETGGTRTAKAEALYIPSGIRMALGLEKNQLIPKKYSPRHILNGKIKFEKYGGNKPFNATLNGISGIYVRRLPTRESIYLLYERRQQVNIPQRRWFFDTITDIYDSKLEQNYDAELKESLSRMIGV